MKINGELIFNFTESALVINQNLKIADLWLRIREQGVDVRLDEVNTFVRTGRVSSMFGRQNIEQPKDENPVNEQRNDFQ